MLKKHIFQQKSSCDIFKYVRYYQTPNPLNGQTPLTFNQQLPFLAFLSYFYLQLGLDQKLVNTNSC